jgi:hypothetical protein
MPTLRNLLLALTAFLLTGALAAQVRIVVTVEGHKGAPTPQLTQNDVMVYQNDERLKVTGWEPVGSDHTALQLWLLIDDGTDTQVGGQLEDLKHFILDLQPTTQVGVGYLRNGTVQRVQELTTDHARASNVLRLPIGIPGVSASPYIALADLIHKWPATSNVREVLMVTSGIDPEYGTGPQNLYLDQAIDAAQRGGVVAHALYYGSAGHLGHSLWQITWGQNYLSQLTDETGGEFFWQGNSNPVSFAPYLTELTQRLKDQHVLTFQAASKGGGGFHKLKLKTEVPHATLVGPSRVYVAK